VDVAKNGACHRILFDAGTTPDGVVENMRRLEVDPSGIETIICSHGHFDHTAGLDGLIRRLGRVSLPVLIHPHFWRQRRLSIPAATRKRSPPRAAERSSMLASKSSKSSSPASYSTDPSWSPAKYPAPPATRPDSRSRRPGLTAAGSATPSS
jgi:metal-dependent hydrolase (beta-lactamase superfamily II)